MDSFNVTITGDRKVELVLDEFYDGLHAALKAEITALTSQLYAQIEAATPSRTGRLRSEERMHVYDDKDRISGRIAISGEAKDFAKAGALEYGAHRATQVSAHQMRLDHVFGQMLAAPMNVLVEAYNRTPDIQEVAFERGPLEAMQPEIVERLQGVVADAVAGGKSVNHEAIVQALFAWLLSQTPGLFKTTGRRVQPWGQVTAQPAMFLRHIGTTDEYTGQLPKTTLDCEVWIYCDAGKNLDAVPDAGLNVLVQAIRAAFVPDDSDDQRFTLNGLVYRCWIEGRSDYAPGDWGTQAIARIPVRITIPWS